MADRSRSRRVRRAFRLLLLTAITVVVWRLFGPGVAVVRDDTLAPFLTAGDIVLIHPVGDVPQRGTIALVRAPLESPSTLGRLFTRFGDGVTDGPTNGSTTGPANGSAGEGDGGTTTEGRSDTRTPLLQGPDRLVPRIIAGLPGDAVTWSDATVSARGDDATFRIDPGTLGTVFEQAIRRSTVPEEHLFLVSLTGGVVDSRMIGPRPRRTVRYRVTRIVWPAERRGPVAPVSSGFAHADAP